MRAGFLEAVKAAGLVTTDGAIGVLATGSLDAETLRAFLRAMPEGTGSFAVILGMWIRSLKGCGPGCGSRARLSGRR